MIVLTAPGSSSVELEGNLKQDLCHPSKKYQHILLPLYHKIKVCLDTMPF